MLPTCRWAKELILRSEVSRLKPLDEWEVEATDRERRAMAAPGGVIKEWRRPFGDVPSLCLLVAWLGFGLHFVLPV